MWEVGGGEVGGEGGKAGAEDSYFYWLSSSDAMAVKGLRMNKVVLHCTALT